MNIMLTKEIFNKLKEENLELIHYFCLKLIATNDQSLVEAWDLQKKDNLLAIQYLFRRGYIKGDNSISDIYFHLSEKGNELLKTINNQ